MSDKQTLAIVTAVGCLSRYRNGIKFTNEKQEVTVDESELATLQADDYLQVEVIGDVDPDGGSGEKAGGNDENGGNSDNTKEASNEKNSSENLPPNNDANMDPNTSDNEKLEDNAGAETKTAVNTTTANDANSDGNQDVTPPAAPDSNLKVGEKLDANIQAMRALDLDLTAKKPTCDELKEKGLVVTAKERDAAWDVLVTEHNEANA